MVRPQDANRNSRQQWDRLTADAHAKPQINRGPRYSFAPLAAGR